MLTIPNKNFFLYNLAKIPGIFRYSKSHNFPAKLRKTKISPGVSRKIDELC